MNIRDDDDKTARRSRPRRRSRFVPGALGCLGLLVGVGAGGFHLITDAVGAPARQTPPNPPQPSPPQPNQPQTNQPQPNQPQSVTPTERIDVEQAVDFPYDI